MESKGETKKDRGTKRGRENDEEEDRHTYGKPAVAVRVKTADVMDDPPTDQEAKSRCTLSSADIGKGKTVEVNVLMEEDKKWHWKESVITKITTDGKQQTLSLYVKDLPAGKRLVTELSSSTRVGPAGTHLPRSANRDTTFSSSGSGSGSGFEATPASDSALEMGLGGTPSHKRRLKEPVKMDTKED